MLQLKLSKTYVIGTKKLKNKQKLQLIGTYENMVQFLTIQKSLTIKWLRWVKAHYDDPFWGVTLFYFLGLCACLNVSHLKLLKEYNLSKTLIFKIFISFYKVKYWSIFVETNVMYPCIQKHKYTPKTI
jgi:hypothetical protein